MKQFEFSIKMTVFGTVKVIATSIQEAKACIQEDLLIRMDEPQIKDQSNGKDELGIIQCNIKNGIVLEIEPVNLQV